MWSRCGIDYLQPEYQNLIVDKGALPHLVDLLKRSKDSSTSRALNSVIRRAADAITNLAHENSSIKTRVRSAYFSKWFPPFQYNYPPDFLTKQARRRYSTSRGVA